MCYRKRIQIRLHILPITILMFACHREVMKYFSTKIPADSHTWHSFKNAVTAVMHASMTLMKRHHSTEPDMVATAERQGLDRRRRASYRSKESRCNLRVTARPRRQHCRVYRCNNKRSAGSVPIRRSTRRGSEIFDAGDQVGRSSYPCPARCATLWELFESFPPLSSHFLASWRRSQRGKSSRFPFFLGVTFVTYLGLT